MSALPRFSRRLLTLLLPAALLGPVLLRAQAPADPSTPVQARFHCLAVTDGGFQGLSFLNGHTEVPLTIPRDFLSPAYDYRGPARFVILRKLPPPPPGSAPAPAATGLPPGRAAAITLDLPPAGGEFLLLFGRSADGRPQAMPVDYSTTDVPLGSYLVWNLSTRTLGFQLEQTRTLIAPGRRELVELHDDQNTYMPLKVFDQAHGQVFGARHLHRPKTRQLVFLSDRPGHPDRVSLRMITQTVFPPPPAAPASAPNFAALPASR